MVPGAGGKGVANPTWFPNPKPQVFDALPADQKVEQLCADGQACPDGFTCFGVGHLVGTYRMADQPKTSVVEPDSRGWDQSNLFLVGEGVFPTVTTVNPTLTLAVLAYRTARAVKAQLQGA